MKSDTLFEHLKLPNPHHLSLLQFEVFLTVFLKLCIVKRKVGLVLSMLLIYSLKFVVGGYFGRVLG